MARLYDLLTENEKQKVKDIDQVRNVEVKDLTVEELQLLPLDDQAGEHIQTHGANILDELLFRQHLRTPNFHA